MMEGLSVPRIIIEAQANEREEEWMVKVDSRSLTQEFNATG
jgi:hypothetical protein